MDLKINRPGFKTVQVDEEIYKVSIPTVAIIKKLQASLALIKNKESEEGMYLMVDWLDSLGFPKHVAESLTAEDLMQIIELLNAKKKT